MDGNSQIFTSWTGAVLLLLPGVLFTGLNFLSDAPMEWGRGALMAYLAVCSVMIAGIAAPHLGNLLVAAVLALAFLSIMMGGTTGLALASGVMIALALATLAMEVFAMHAMVAPGLALLGLAATLRHLLS